MDTYLTQICRHPQSIERSESKHRKQELSADMVGDGVREFVNDGDEPAFLERELMRIGVNGSSKSVFTTIQVDRCPFVCFESI